jgi:hypothetical protein
MQYPRQPPPPILWYFTEISAICQWRCTVYSSRRIFPMGWKVAVYTNPPSIKVRYRWFTPNFSSASCQCKTMFYQTPRLSGPKISRSTKCFQCWYFIIFVRVYKVLWEGRAFCVSSFSQGIFSAKSLSSGRDGAARGGLSTLLGLPRNV